MNNNYKLLFLLTTVFMLLLTVTAINAVEDNDTSLISADTTTDNVVEEVDVSVVNNNKLIDKDTQSKVIKKESMTHIVNQDSVDTIFGGEEYGLADTVSEGDTLDFQGTIDKNHSIVINKPINVISSTQDAIISLHTVAGSLLGEDPGNSFVVNKQASGSNISGLYLNNTECWIYNVNDTVLKNMTMHVQDARVGSGVGQTAVRYCYNVTFDSCHIYTENNGGSSSFVWTASYNCTIVNSTVEGQGNVGNILYLNTNNAGDKPDDFDMNNSNLYNTIKNCTIYTPSNGAICVPLQNMGKFTLVDGLKAYGAGSSIQSGTNGTMINCEAYGGTGIYISANSTAYNNTIVGNGTTSVQAGSTVYDNSFKATTIGGANVTFENNTVDGRLTLSYATNVNNNQLVDIVATATNAKNSNITNNNITGFINATMANITIENNTINTTQDVAIYMTGAGSKIVNNYISTPTKAGLDAISINANVLFENNVPEVGINLTITDETYPNFFDEDHVFIKSMASDYSTIILDGTFNNKEFIFDNYKLTVKGNNAVINNGTITAVDNASVSIENIQFNNINVENEYSINLASDFNTVKNVTITRNSLSGISREIYVSGNNNTVFNNKITMAVGIENMDYSEYPFAMANTEAIAVLGSGNIIRNNTINATNTTDNAYGTVSLIDIASKTIARDNVIANNKIVADTTGYVYGVNLGANANYNNISSNNITIKSLVNYANGIQIGYSPATNNTINNNSMYLNGYYAYGVLCSAYGDVVANSTINTNTIYINATEAVGIEICGSTTDLIQNTTINANKVYVNSYYAIGIGVAGTNIVVNGSTIMVNGTTNETNAYSYDIIKPTTAGVIVLNSENVRVGNNTMNITNGPNYILNNTKSSTVLTTSASATTKYTNSNNINIILDNSNNNTITGERSYTSNDYSVVLIKSSDNKIYANDLNASNARGGDNAVYMDETSTNNVVENNTPLLGVLTDESYSSYFDDEGNFLENVDILVLGSDLYNKDLTFYNNITMKSLGNYTIYNGTITFNEGKNGSYAGSNIVINQINFDNVNKPVFVDNMLNSTQQRQIRFNTSNIKVMGDDVVVFDSTKDVKTYTRLYLYYNNIIVDATNAVVVNMTRMEYTSNDYVDFESNNVSVTTEESNNILNIVNSNLDFYDNNIEQIGKDVTTVYANNAYANGLFFTRNNITITGSESARVLDLSDNHASNAKFANNTMHITSLNPVTAISVTNSSNVYIGQGSSTTERSYWNTIIVDAENGDVPIVLADSQNSSVRNNFIAANDVCGIDTVVGVNVTNITPTQAIVSIEVGEARLNNPVTITAKATTKDGADVEGNLVFIINDEVVYTAEGNVGSYEFTPTKPGDIDILVRYENSTVMYGASYNQTTLTIGAVIISMDDIQANAGETITINATLTDESGNLINTGKVAFKVNGKTVKDANGKVIYVKVVDGKASVEYTVDEKFEGKDIVVTAVYSGSANYMPVQNTSILSVAAPVIEPEFVDTPTTAAKGESIKLSVQVGDITGKIAFKLNGKTLKDDNGKIIYATITDGVASIDYVIPETYKAKDYTLSAVIITSSAERIEINQTLTITE